MPSNFQLGDNQKVPYTLNLSDAENNPTVLEPTDQLSITSSDTASLTVIPDATPVSGAAASGFLVAGTKLQTGVTVTATITHADGTSATASDLIDIVAGEAATVAFSLGAPVSQ